MTRIKHLIISLGVTVAMGATVAAPALSYSTPNATLNSGGDGYSSPTAILSDGGATAASPVTASSPNAILGSANVSDLAAAPASEGTGGFDWSDALVGAGSAIAVLFGMSVAFVLARRRRAPTVQPSG